MKDILATVAGIVVVGLLIFAFIMGGPDTAQAEINRIGGSMVDALQAIP